MLGSQYETESLDVKEVCFDEEQNILECMKNQEKIKILLNDADVRNVE